MIQAVADSALKAVTDVDWAETLNYQVLVPRLVRVGIVILVAIITYSLIQILIARLLRIKIDEEDPLVRRVREQRALTIASLLRNVALITTVVVVALTTLDIMLDDIGPILASFGILGLAFSFGAQTLVKDVISGTFMLMEGQFAIGDVVRVADVSGMVEKITLRTTVLRDNEGVVHIIPNGSITRVSNMTKSWSRAVLDISVAYREDIDRVVTVLRDLLKDFEADPEWGPLLLEPPDVPGIERLSDSGVVVRVMAKTLPQKQWEVSRELRRRIKMRFDREGIEMPFLHRAPVITEGKPTAAIANAAAMPSGDS